MNKGLLSYLFRFVSKHVLPQRMQDLTNIVVENDASEEKKLSKNFIFLVEMVKGPSKTVTANL